MALTLHDRDVLIHSGRFLGRIEAALMKYAAFLRGTTPNNKRGAWALDTLNSEGFRRSQVDWIKYLVLENVAAAQDLTPEQDDSLALDADIQAQVETQVNQRIASS